MSREMYEIGLAVKAQHEAEGHVATFWVTPSQVGITCVRTPCREFAQAARRS